MSDRIVEIHINMQGRVIVRYEGGKCVDVTDTRGRKLYSAPAQVNQQLLEALKPFRFDVSVGGGCECCGHFVEHDQCEDGSYVRYDDVESVLSNIAAAQEPA
jgi:hypothetical protein